MDLREELKSAGAYPTGPCSAWPQDRNKELVTLAPPLNHVTRVNVTPRQMVGGLFRAAGQAISHGRVSAEIREERYNTCKACPFFIEDSKRCSECGCFMEAKTWIGGDPDMLCPRRKWGR